MFKFHTDLLNIMLINPEQVLHGLENNELELVERCINDFDKEEIIPPISEIKDSKILEEYYSYMSFISNKAEIEDLALKIQSLPGNILLSTVRELFDITTTENMDIYLLPIGLSIGDAYVRDVDGNSVIFINLTSIIRYYGKNNDERLKNLIPVIEHEVFHVLFARLCTQSDYWDNYFKNITHYEDAKLLILNEGIAHFIADKNRIDNFLHIKNDIIKETVLKYHEVMSFLKKGDLLSTDVKEHFIKGTCNSYFEKYFAIPGMLAAYIIYRDFGTKGIKRCLEDITFFEECGLKKIDSFLEKRTDLIE
ncbi:MAG: hypothetical protein KAX49_10715 [Halanaerobiales bacterium]|nr:hypothetical protein [Halanaerobiales bacterium]